MKACIILQRVQFFYGPHGLRMHAQLKFYSMRGVPDFWTKPVWRPTPEEEKEKEMDLGRSAARQK